MESESKRISVEAPSNSIGQREERVLLFTDLVGSTRMKLRHGDARIARALASHDELFRRCLSTAGGEEIHEAGDGFFAAFERPAAAVRCALEFLPGLKGIEAPVALEARIGIHMGPVMRLKGGGAGGMLDKYVGLAADTANRVMELAEGGQILLTRKAFDLARMESYGEEPLEWLAHGDYMAKGLDEPMEIFEAGTHGASPLRPPGGGDKIRRSVAAADEATLGWRPSAGAGVPNRDEWRLDRQIGEGGFGEVWLADHRESGDLRTFKFCFYAGRARALKREFNLLRLIKEVLGEREDIVRLHAVNLDEPPYYLEMDYTEGGDLKNWSEGRGGIGSVALETRLDLVARVCEAVDAAHSVGVIHKDIKPGNVLIEDDGDGQPRARLTDFGIGQIVDTDPADKAPFTLTGVTVVGTPGASRSSSGSGTRLYMAPELVAGQAPSVQSDIYSLGVLLFQMVVGDFSRPIGPGWEREIGDELLREDIEACVDVIPARRLRTAHELGARVRSIESRRAELAKEREYARALERSARRRHLAGLASGAAIVFLLVALVLFGALRRERVQLRLADEANGKLVWENYAATLGVAQKHLGEANFYRASNLLDAMPREHRAWEWGHLRRRASPMLLSMRKDFVPHWILFSPDGRYLYSDHQWGGLQEVYDLAQGVPIFSAELDEFSGSIYCAAFSADGRVICLPKGKHSVALIDLASGEMIGGFEGGQLEFWQIVFSPDGRLAAGGLIDREAGERVIIIWDYESRRELRRFRLPFSKRAGLAGFTKGNRELVCFDQEVSLLDVENGESVVLGKGRGAALAREPGIVAVLRTGHEVQFWDTEYRGLMGVAEQERGEPKWQTIDISPDGQLLATGSWSLSWDLWSTASGEHLRRYDGLTRELYVVKFAPNGRVVATGGGMVNLWDTEENRPSSRMGWLKDEHSESFTPSSLDRLLLPFNKRPEAFNHAKTALAVSGPGKSLHLWAIPGLNLLRRMPQQEEQIKSIAFSPDDSLVATASADGIVRIWNVESGSLIREIQVEEDWMALSVSFSADGGRIAVGSGFPQNTPLAGGRAAVFDLASGEEIHEVAHHQGPITLVAYSPDGRWLITGSYGQVERGTQKMGTSIKIWDAETGSKLAGEILGLNWALEAAFSLDGRRLLVSGVSWEPLLWDLENQCEVLRITDGDVTKLGFHPDSRRFFTIGRKIRIHSAEDGRELATIDEGTSPATFSADGKELIARAPFSNELIAHRADDWVGGEVGGEFAKRLEIVRARLGIGGIEASGSP